MKSKDINPEEVSEIVGKINLQEENINVPAPKPIEKMDDAELEYNIFNLEKTYPQFDRLPEFKMIGFVTNKNTGKTPVPVYARTWIDNSKYPPAKLRELRAKNGVGKRKKGKGRVFNIDIPTVKFGTSI